MREALGNETAVYLQVMTNQSLDLFGSFSDIKHGRGLCALPVTNYYTTTAELLIFASPLVL